MESVRPNHPGSSRILQCCNFLSESSSFHSLATPNWVKSSGGHCQEKMSRTTFSSTPPILPSFIRRTVDLDSEVSTETRELPKRPKSQSRQTLQTTTVISNRLHMSVDLCCASILSVHCHHRKEGKPKERG